MHKAHYETPLLEVISISTNENLLLKQSSGESYENSTPYGGNWSWDD